MAEARSLTNQQVRVRNLLKSTYQYMVGGLLVTAFVSFMVISNPTLLKLAMNRTVLIVAILLELGLVFYLSARVFRMTAQNALLLFILYSALNGFTLSIVFFAYTKQSVMHAFLVSAGAFGGMSLYALTTKKDLTGMGKYLIMGLWGVIIASLLSFFFQSSGFSMVISLVALIIFMGLTAYHTQTIQRWSAESASLSDEDYKKMAIIGALKLYLDFINIFLIMLRFLGVARRS